MTKRQFVVLAFRLFALLLLYNLIINLGYILRFSLAGGESVWTMILVPAFAVAVMLAVISFFWGRSEWLMEKIFAIPALSDQAAVSPPPQAPIDEIEENVDIPPEDAGLGDYYETPLSAENVELIAFSLVGLWVAFETLPHLLRDLGFELVGRYGRGGVSDSIWLVLPSLVQVALGVWLFLRPWQFQEWIVKLRPKAVKNENTSTPPAV